MERKNIIILFLLGISLSSFSQNLENYSKWNIKVGYFRTPSNKVGKQLNNISIEGNYRFINIIEIGPYIGIGRQRESENNYQMDYLYGINTSLHILPLIAKRSNLRFNLYLSGKCGGVYRKINFSNYYENEYNKFTWGIYVGTAYYFTKYIGAFCEGGYEETVLFKDYNMRYGLTFKF